MIRILVVRIKSDIYVIKTIKLGYIYIYIYHRLGDNKNVLVKVIRIMNQNFLAANNNNNDIIIWNIRDYNFNIYQSDHRRHKYDKCLKIFDIILAHEDSITSLQVIYNRHGPKETYSVSSSKYRTLQIWIIPEFTEVKNIYCRLSINDFAFVKFGYLQYIYIYIYTINNRGKIVFWSEHTDFIMDELHYKDKRRQKRLRTKDIVDKNPNSA